MLGGQSLDRAADSDPGRVDEHVEPAEALAMLGDDSRAIVRVSDVGGDRDGAELLCSRLHALRTPRGERQGVPLVPQHARNCEADARGAAGDERAFHSRDPKGDGRPCANRAG